MTDAGIAQYYDRLLRWNDAAAVFGFGGGRGALTVHRALADPSANGRPTTTRLHDVLMEALPDRPGLRVLDAGCGLGGTMLDVAARRHGTFVGLTLSERQAVVGTRAARRAGLAGRVQVLVQTYDDPPPGPFDLVLAIEALAHSPSPEQSLAALTGVLAPGGALVVVDDMPQPDAEGSADLAAFRAGWRCPVLWSHRRYVAALARLGFDLVVDRDLTGECRPRALGRIALLERVNRLARRAIPARAFRQIMDSHLGGLALERLTVSGLMQYRLLIARRP